MNRKEIKDAIAKVGAGTFALDGSMSLLNKEKGEVSYIDLPSVFAIIRGTLVWVDTLLEDDAKPEPNTVKDIQRLLTCVGSSIAYDLSANEAE